MNQKSFGRRQGFAPESKRAAMATPEANADPLPVKSWTAESSPNETDLAELSTQADSDEFQREWDTAHLVGFPWGKAYLMAGLSFGIASFALPDTVNEAANWLLYLLAGASIWAWYQKRKERNAT